MRPVTMTAVDVALGSARLPMNEPLLRLFRRLIDELDRPESVEWDTTESTINPAVYST